MRDMDVADPRTPLPNIEDNAKGVAGHVVCCVWCWTKDGRKYRMMHVQRWLLEQGHVFPKIRRLAEDHGGLSRILVEVEVP